MNFAYGWAFARPVRKVYYNLVITGLSIAVAFLSAPSRSSACSPANCTSTARFWDFMANFDINKAGFAIAALFVIVWVIAIAYWKLGRVEDKWRVQPTVEAGNIE